VRVGHQEAFLIFRKWLSEATFLRCRIDFPCFSASCRGRLAEVSDEGLRLFSDDTFTEVALLFKDDTEFDCSEAGGEHGFGVLIVFDLRAEGPADTVALFEIIEEML